METYYTSWGEGGGTQSQEKKEVRAELTFIYGRIQQRTKQENQL